MGCREEVARREQVLEKGEERCGAECPDFSGEDSLASNKAGAFLP